MLNPIKVWTRFKNRRQCGGTTPVLRLDWSPDGECIVTAHAMNNSGPTAQIINRSGWKTNLDLVGHRRAVTCAVSVCFRACRRKIESKIGYRNYFISTFTMNLRVVLQEVTALEFIYLFIHLIFQKSHCTWHFFISEVQSENYGATTKRRGEGLSLLRGADITFTRLYVYLAFTRHYIFSATDNCSTAVDLLRRIWRIFKHSYNVISSCRFTDFCIQVKEYVVCAVGSKDRSISIWVSSISLWTRSFYYPNGSRIIVFNLDVYCRLPVTKDLWSFCTTFSSNLFSTLPGRLLSSCTLTFSSND